MAGAVLVGAIFSDYDGTLAPLEAARGKSAIPASLFAELERIPRSVPIAIVTSKDADFVVRRTAFASAWACAGGLDICLPDGRRFTEEGLLDTSESCAEAQQLFSQTSVIEAKRGAGGRLLGFSVDWRAGSKPSGLEGFLRRERRAGFFVRSDPSEPFADIFGGRPDKGRATKFLKGKLAFEGAVMFMGDSRADNPGFSAADVSVGVMHGQPVDGLKCEMTIEYRRLGRFLSLLRRDGMDFERASRLTKRRG